MNAAYLHLTVNHFPVILSLLAVAGVLVAMVTGRAFFWQLGLLCGALAGLSVIVAFFTGRGAEEIMEKVWYVSRPVLHEHEEAGEWALWMVMASGVVSAYALWRYTRTARDAATSFPYWLRALAGVLAVVAAATTVRAAFLGGKIVHEAPAIQHAPAGWRDTTAAPKGDRT